MHSFYDRLHSVLVGPIPEAESGGCINVAPDVLFLHKEFTPEKFAQVMNYRDWVLQGYRVDCMLQSHKRLAEQATADTMPSIRLDEMSEIASQFLSEPFLCQFMLGCARHVKLKMGDSSTPLLDDMIADLDLSTPQESEDPRD